MRTLREMERVIARYQKRCYAQEENGRKGFLQQIDDERMHNRIEEALARCTLENEVLVRKVYFEKRSLAGMSKKEQKKRKKAGLKQFFDCLCQ